MKDRSFHRLARALGGAATRRGALAGLASMGVGVGVAAGGAGIAGRSGAGGSGVVIGRCPIG